jgi:rhamnose utilization protein RhaD (predicted bifunctional aldolase and dehydrogenase)
MNLQASNPLLDVITELSHEFGTAEYVKGGGGNTSAKTTDTLWVKPSGTTLAGLTPESFVAMDRKKLAQLFEIEPPSDSSAREALVKDMMADAVKPGSTGRPSVEAPLHDIMPGTFVVHTHCTIVNGMTCARHGAAACARLFPDALWVPYVDPGFTLCMEVRRRLRGQRLVILENHGIFVAGESANEVRATYHRVIDALRAEYAKAGIATELKIVSPAAPEPVTPDHIVYSKKPKLGPAMAADAALIRQLANAFGGVRLLDDRARHFIETWEVEAYRQTRIL